MAERVLLHVGAPKTGTSYIESIIWSHRRQLIRDGIFLPGRSRKAHDALMGDVRGGVWAHPDTSWTWQRLVEIVERRQDTVLVSKEMLSGATAKQAANAVAPLAKSAEVHVIVTARHLAGSLPSSWQQGIQARKSVPFGDWINEVKSDPGHGFWRYQDPLSIMRRWAPGFPPERVHVILMPRNSTDPAALWRLYASVLGIEPDSYKTPARPKHESLGAVEAEVLRRVNKSLGTSLPMRLPYLRHVHPYLRDVLRTASNPIKFGVPDQHTEWLMERGLRMVTELQNYPCMVVGDIADLIPQVTPGLISPDDVSAEQVAARAVDALAQVLVNRSKEPVRAPVPNAARVTPPARKKRRGGEAAPSWSPRVRRKARALSGLMRRTPRD